MYKFTNIFYQLFIKKLSNLDRYSSFFILIVPISLLVALKRPDQIMFPEVWNEDGLLIIPRIIENGLTAVFQSTNGYLILPSNIITYISLLISFEYYPIVSTVIGVLVQATCIVLIMISPTHLQYKFASGLLLIMLPMDAEVFVLPQYTFWWTSLLLFLALIWQPGAAPRIRYLFLVVGVFSSPVGLALIPLFGLKAAVTRWHEDIKSLIVILLLSMVQLYFLLKPGYGSVQNIQWQTLIDINLIFIVIQKFFGEITIAANTPYAFWIGLQISILLLSGVFFIPKNQRVNYTIIVMLLIVTIAISCLRVPIVIASPVGNGPRYFFFPLVLITWLLVWLFASGHIFLRYAVIAIGFVTLPVSVNEFQRHQERLTPWWTAASACRLQNHVMPVHHDGSLATQHNRIYPASLCRAASEKALF